jgi:transcriptional regulator with XRE-family HTH domain
MRGRNPTVRRRRLANELRRFREASGLTIEQVAERLECSSSKVSRLETAKASPTPRDVRDMLQIYGVTGQRLEDLLQMAREARQKSDLYTEFQDISYKRTMADLEVEAEFINQYSALLVPGFLQIPDYARATLRAIRIKEEPGEIERRVEFRLARQKVLTQPDATVALWVVLDEAALRRQVGGREVMRTQLERLTEAAELPNITLQVLPFSAGAHAGMDGEFTIIGFPDPVDPGVVFIENSTRDLYLEDDGAIRRYRQLFDHLRAAALDPSESVAFIVNMAKEL